MMSQQQRIHDPLIDTIGTSDDEKVEEVTSAVTQEQLDIIATTHDNSMLAGFNGDSLYTSGGSPFKKNYPTVDSVEPLASLPLDPDNMAPFGIDLGSMHNSPLPTRSKDVDHFSVSVSDSLPSHVMELDSPEPDLYEQEIQDCSQGLLMSTNTKELIMQTDTLQPSLAAEEREIVIQQAKDLISSPGVSNGEEFDLNDESAKITLGNEAVTYSQSDIFASQPITFGLEPKTIDLSPENFDSFDDDSPVGLPEISEIRTPSKQPSPYSMLEEIEYVSSKRKREYGEENIFKKPNIEKTEFYTPFNVENNIVDDDIKILDESTQSVEVIYDNKLQEKTSANSQEMHLFLSSNTQNIDSQQMEAVSFKTNEMNDSASSIPSLELSYANSNGEDAVEVIDRVHQSINYDNQNASEVSAKLMKAVVKLPSFDTPSQLTEESGEPLFLNATKAARANVSNKLESLQKSDSNSPLFDSPAEMLVEKSISSASPNNLQVHTKSKQSTPVTIQNSSSSTLFSSRNNPTQNSSQILAEDSDDDVKSISQNSSVPIISSGSSKDDTDIEIVMDKNDVKNIRDLKYGKWKSTVIRPPVIIKWIHPSNGDVMYSIQGEDSVHTELGSMMEKIITTGDLPFLGGRRISNISSISGITSDGYLGDKSSFTSSSCTTASLPDVTRLESSRRSMASVISISPPKTLFKLPFKVEKTVNSSTQTDESSPTKLKIKRLRGRPKGRRIYPPLPIMEITETDISTSETDSCKVVETLKDSLKPSKVAIPSVSPIKEALESTEKKDVNIIINTSTDPDMAEDFFGQICPLLQEKLKDIQANLSEEEEKIFLSERIKHLESSDDVQNTIVRQRVREIDISPEMLVFARYNSDKNYYSAIIKEKDKEDRWKIIYNLDNQKASVREIYILPTDILPKSFPVFVRHPSKDFHEPGLVRGHNFKEGVLLHIVEKLNGYLVMVPHSHISLKELQANVLLKARASYRSLVSSPGGDLALDNILLRRTRGITNSPRQLHRKADPNFDTSGQEDSNPTTIHRKSQTRLDRLITMEESESSEFSLSPYRKQSSVNPQRTPRSCKTSGKSPKSVKRAVRSCGPTKTGIVTLPLNPVVRLNQLNETEIPLKDTPKKRGRKPISSKTPKKTRKLNEDEPNCFNTEYGPVPSENTSLFTGYSILITEMIHLDKLVDFDPTPMERDHLTRQIEIGGSKVMTSFSEANLIMVQEAKRAIKSKDRSSTKNDLCSLTTLKANDSPAKVICVSNAPCRTAKFIQCLTVGIPIVNTSWIINSCKKNECLNWIWYLLPAGVSLLTQTMMVQPFHDFNAIIYLNLSKVVDVLKGDKVFLATSSEPTFKETWLELLATAEAHVFTKTSSGKLNRLMDRKTSVVLADASIPADELQRAEDINAPVVSTEWFIQCIIQRCKLQYTAHPKFKYNYTEDEHR